MGRNLTTRARTFISEANMPDNMWPEAYMTAGYVLNRTPVKKLSWKTPFKAFTKQVPSIAHMHPFGCKAYVVEHKIPKLEKMRERAVVGYLVGYAGRNLHRILIYSCCNALCECTGSLRKVS